MAEGFAPEIRADAEEAMLLLRVGTSTRVLFGVCGASALVVALAWSPLQHWRWFALWFCVVLASQGFRIWSEVSACQSTSARPLSQRVNIASASALGSGVTQAISLAFFPLMDAFEQSLHTVILLVMATGAVVYTAGHPRTYIPYLAPIIAGLVLAWWTLSAAAQERPWLAVGFGLLIAVYGFNLLGYARDTWTIFLNAAAMRHQEAQQSHRLAVAVRAAEAASHAKTRFLAAASHDLRQPIHTIALLKQSTVQGAKVTLGIEVRFVLLAARAVHHGRAAPTDAAVRRNRLLRFGELVAERIDRGARHRFSQVDLDQAIAVALKQTGLVAAQAEHLVAVHRLKKTPQRFGVETVGSERKLGHGAGQYKHAEHIGAAQHGQAVEGVLPEVSSSAGA